MLALWKKSYDQPRQHIKKQCHYFATKFCIVKAMVFSVVKYGCECWAVKKVEHWRIDAFELWCWRRLLHVPWTARRCNQSILKETSPGFSLEGLMLRLKEESEEVGLKLNIQKTKTMASGPITSWQIDGEKMETMTDFIFLHSKITADVTVAMKLKDACSLEEKLWPT